MTDSAAPLNKSRRVFCATLAGAATSLALPMINRGSFQVFAASGDTYSRRTLDLMERALVVDMLNPLGYNAKRLPEWLKDPASFTEEDYQWARTSGIDVFHPAIGDRGWQAYDNARELFANWNSLIAANPQWLQRIDDTADMREADASGRIGIIYGTQNSDHFRTPEDVADFYHMGQRVSQLTYNWQNQIGAGPLEDDDPGLSLFGVEIVEAMNRAGMTVDVSHCADNTTLDAFEVSKRPVAITHSNCRALNPGYRRAKTDEAIRGMAATGGVMGVTTLRAFVRDHDPVTVDHVIDHIDHIVRLTSIEHVGIGSDSGLAPYGKEGFEDYKTMPRHAQELYKFRKTIDIEELGHPKRMFDITEALIRRGYSDEHIELILGGNFTRMLGETWKPVAAEEASD